MKTDDLRSIYGKSVHFNCKSGDEAFTDEYVLWLEKQFMDMQNQLSPIQFIEREIEIMTSKKSNMHWNTPEFIDLHNKLGAAKLFHEWLISNYK